MDDPLWLSFVLFVPLLSVPSEQHRTRFIRPKHGKEKTGKRKRETDGVTETENGERRTENGFLPEKTRQLAGSRAGGVGTYSFGSVSAAMRRIPFALDVNVSELINLPMFDGTKCFLVFTVSNDKITNNFKKLHTTSHTSPVVLVKGHRVKFGETGRYSTDFKIHASSNGLGSTGNEILADKWLTISFLIKKESHQELLGVVTINLTEYVNDRNSKDMRLLLDKSKTNSIAKINILVRHLSQDDKVNYTTKSTAAARSSSENSQKSTLTSHQKHSDISPTFNLSVSNSGSILKPRSSLSLRRSSSSGMRDDLALSNVRTPTGSLFKPSSPSPSTSISNSMSPTDPRHRAIPSPKAASKSPSVGIATSMERKGSRLNHVLDHGRRTHSESIPGSRKDMMNNGDGGNDGHSREYEIIDTQTLMNMACEQAISGTTLLDELTNKTYRFTWQLRTMQYEEFTPAECVKDIVEKNGNGWRKNDEGVDLVDVIENDFRETYLANRHHNYHNGVVNHDVGDDDDIPDVFEDFRNFGEIGDDDDYKTSHGIYHVNSSGEESGSDSDDDTDNGDIFYSYYKNRKRNVSKVKRFKPLTEAEVREDLRSWHITVKP